MPEDDRREPEHRQYDGEVKETEVQTAPSQAKVSEWRPPPRIRTGPWHRRGHAGRASAR